MQSPKHRLYEQFAELARTLGHAHRLELLEHLAQGERSVEVLAERCRLSVANASQHLQHLRRGGFVMSRRQGKRVFYRLSNDLVLAALTALRGLAEQNLADVREIIGSYFGKLDDLEPVPRRELLQRLRDGSVTLLDVRPEDEFDLGHLPGALNIPLPELMQRLSELPAKQEIIAYCRGPYCVLSFEAVAVLRARGFKVRRLEDGFPEWRAAGLAVETA